MKSQSLIEALELKNLKEAEYWALKNPDSVNAYCSFGKSPLEESTECPPEFMEMLIKHGALVNLQDSQGRTALHLAIIREEDQAVETLLKHAADIRLKNEDRFDAVHQAIYYENLGALKLMLNSRMLDLGVKFNRKNYLDFCIMYSGNSAAAPNMFALLIDQGLSVNQLRASTVRAKKNETINPLALQILEERFLALKEQQALSRVVEKTQIKKGKNIEQDAMMPFDGLVDARGIKKQRKIRL